MASQPQPPQRPAPPQPQRPAAPPAQPAQPHHPAPAAAAPKPIGDQQALKTELDKAPKTPEPPKAMTIADEQRERSAEIEKMGVEAYKRSIDQRDPKDQPKAVEGVNQLHGVAAHGVSQPKGEAATR